MKKLLALILLILLMAGCSGLSSRSSVRFIKGGFNPIMRTAKGDVVSMLIYEKDGIKLYPTFEVKYDKDDEITSVKIDMKAVLLQPAEPKDPEPSE